MSRAARRREARERAGDTSAALLEIERLLRARESAMLAGRQLEAENHRLRIENAALRRALEAHAPEHSTTDAILP